MGRVTGKKRWQTKKSLGDIVREEVQKPQQPIESVAETQATQASSSSSRRKNPTKADLEQMVSELKSTLEEAQDSECTLQEKVMELQAMVQDKDELITELKQNLEQVEALKQELEEAQDTALQLSEANTKLVQELDTLKTAPTTLKPTQPQKRNLPQLVQRPQHALTQPGGDEDFAKNTWLL
jgi:chromosome segregation ATPase